MDQTNNFHQKEISDIFKIFNTSEKGLSITEALLRLQKYGFNRLKKVRQTPLIFKFLLQFKDLLAIILLVAAAIASISGEPRDSLIILTIVLINALIGFIQEFKAEKVLSAFKKHLPSFAKVIRDEEEKQVLSVQIVPGDILILEAGDAVPADARLFEAYDIKTNDISLTGESQAQPKKNYLLTDEKILSDIDNMVFMGTQIVEGQGKAVVVKTGMSTEFGKIAQTTQTIKEAMTPLQKELFHTGKTVAVVASAVTIFVLILLYIMGRELNEALLFAIAAGVAMVPEGLPAAMSVALSLGAQRMLKKNALVKKLIHVESLGSVTTICTDKTGTITTGNMTVAKIFPDAKNISAEQKELILKNLALCNNAVITDKKIGDTLEIALLEYVQTQIGNVEKIIKENKRIFEIPFVSQKKIMSTVNKVGEENYVFTKGACLEVLELCDISEEEKKKIILENDNIAKNGLRVLALAYKKMDTEKFEKAEIEKNLKFLGLVGLQDPPREGVKEAINICHKAKIKVIMVTGDHGLTAKAIAQQIGLANENTKVVTGIELHNMDDEKLKEILKTEKIFARIDPSQKLRIVENLQEMGEVTAVTGDGVNDVPALVKADVGISMGKIGTDVTKEAADMILLDDHFATIVSAIQEGRRIFDNAKKFVFYVFSSNSGELFAPLLGIVLGLPLPLIAIQILAIDLGTDVFPSLALGQEKEEPKIMESSPRSKSDRIMNIGMLSHLLQVGLIMGFLGLGIFLYSLYTHGWHWGKNLSLDDPVYWQATAACYATLVFCQFANALSCRSKKLSFIAMGLFSNLYLIGAEIISFFMLWLIIGFKPFQNIFRTSWPEWHTWILILLAFVISLTYFEVRKKIVNQKKANV